MCKHPAALLIALAILSAIAFAAPATARRSYRSTPPGPGRSALAPAFALRAPLSASFSSVAPGAPPSAPVGMNPSGIAADEATHTVYVVNQADDTVSVIDARACNAEHLSGCAHPLATIGLGPGELGNGPISALVSPDGGTLYVASPDGANELAVIDAATCNATRTSGCATGPVATVATGQGPLDLAEDPGTDTLYVANIGDNTISVIDGARCNAEHPSGCRQAPTAVAVGSAPVAVAVDRDTRTVYVANIGDDTVSVIDARRCNAQYTAGCPRPGQTPPVQAVGGAPGEIGVSGDGHSIYVANSGNGVQGLEPGGSTVSVIDATLCSGGHPQGCSTRPAPVVSVGGGQDDQPQGLAVDKYTGNVYVANSSDGTLSVIDSTRCAAGHLADCAQPAPAIQVGAEPNAVAVDPGVHTVYVSDSVDNAVAVIADDACAGEHPQGCRPAPAPAAPLAPDHQLTGAAVDPAENTAYVIDSGVNQAGPYVLDLIDTSKCNRGNVAGCDPHPPLATVALPSSPLDIQLDPRTDTLYVSEGGPGPDQLEVIAAASCNVRRTSCAKTATIPFADGNVPQDIAVDSATRTVYLGFLADTAVIDARHCNAQDMTGCQGQPRAAIPVPFGGFAVAPDTLYVTGFESPDAPGWVDVIDTRHCQAADTSQCATQQPPKVTVGLFPDRAVVDLAHHTLYALDFAGGDRPGQLSMIDTMHCNGDDTSGCAGQTPAAIPMARAPLGETFDPFTSTLYVTNFANASVSLISTTTCNATRVAGCPHVPSQVVVGSGPFSAALDPADRTVYVPNFYDGTVSMIRTANGGT